MYCKNDDDWDWEDGYRSKNPLKILLEPFIDLMFIIMVVICCFRHDEKSLNRIFRFPPVSRDIDLHKHNNEKNKNNTSH